MTTAAVAVVLGLIVALMVKVKAARASVVVICILFGFVLQLTSVGRAVEAALSSVGHWIAAQLGSL